MALVWDNFRIFDDNCILTSARFNTNGLQNDRLSFYAWLSRLKGLQTQPHNCGIPAARVNDVRALLDAFFPGVQANNPPANPQPVDIRFAQAPGNPRYLPNPVTVSFGPNNQPVDISDGPSALGYIFSIANPPTPAPGAPAPPARTYANFGLPLLAIYARCLYLAYVGPGRGNFTDVPYMSCIMYTTDQAGTFSFLLGSTYVTGVVNALAQTPSAEKRRMMNDWRRTGVLNTPRGLAYYNPTRNGALAPLCPVMEDATLWAFWSAVRGYGINWPGRNLFVPGAVPPQVAVFTPTPPVAYCNNVFNQARLAFVAAWAAANPGSPPLAYFRRFDVSNATFAPTPGQPSYSTQLYNVLRSIIQLRWTPGFTMATPATAAQMTGFLTTLVRLIYIPHMFQRRVTAAGVEPNIALGEVTMPAFDGIAAPIITALLATYRPAMMATLDRVFYWVSNGDDALKEAGPDKPRWGRCAETHPVVALMPPTTPGRILPPAGDNPQANPLGHPVSPVRGFAFCTRRFGNLRPTPAIPTTRSLATSFRATTLNNIQATDVRDPVYRLPCRNCQALLPVLDVPQGAASYSADLWTLFPAGAAQVY